MGVCDLVRCGPITLVQSGCVMCMTWSTAGTLQYGPDLVLGISDLVRFTQIWWLGDLVTRKFHGSESSLCGLFALGSESARERKVQIPQYLPQRRMPKATPSRWKGNKWHRSFSGRQSKNLSSDDVLFSVVALLLLLLVLALIFILDIYTLKAQLYRHTSTLEYLLSLQSRDEVLVNLLTV